MRDVSPLITAAWESGIFMGETRNMARVTLQQANIKLYDFGYNLYASLPFGATTECQELPNVKSVSWDRDGDSEVASMTLELYNTEPLPPGVVLTRDFDQPGYFTYNRGKSKYSVRWGHTPNEWTNVLLPDNLLRTYEGYGVDFTVCPDEDPHLEQTGVWMIDKVAYNTQGLITVTCRDVGRILTDQICFPPVVPKKHYPINFTSTTVAPGFVPGQTTTKLVTSGGDYDRKHPPPASWTGPLTGPVITASSDQDTYATITVSPVALPPVGYRIAGYQLTVDNVEYPEVFQIANPGAVSTANARVTSAQNARNATTAGTPARYAAERTLTARKLDRDYMVKISTGSGVRRISRLTNGDVYLVNVQVVYLRLSDGRRVASNRGPDWFVRPGQSAAPNISGGSGAADNPGNVSSLIVDTDADGNMNVGETHPGMIAFTYTSTGKPTTFTCVLYTRHTTYPSNWPVVSLRGKKRLLRTVTTWQPPTVALGTVVRIDKQIIGTAIGPNYNCLVYGRSYDTDFALDNDIVTDGPDWVMRGSRTGQGAVRFCSDVNKSAFYMPPTPGAYPQQATTPVRVVTGKKGEYAAIGGRDLKLAYETSSNDYYDGAGDRDFYGHNPRDAFDSNAKTYFLSVGNSSPARGFAFEWVQGSCKGETLTGVKFSTVKSGYHAYVSVFARGTWVHFNAADVIPYNPDLPQSHNGGNIPFVAQADVPSESTQSITFKQPIPGVTKVRLTLRNLKDFDLGPYQYRGAIRELVGVTDGSGGTETGTINPGPILDNTSPNVVQTYTVTTPPYVQPGVGQIPGKYNDYTDLVKLFCAWAGFFWPKDAEMVCCGDPVPYPFAPGPYGLPRYIDPVLGADAGRVWGDFEQTGTAGITDLTTDLFDKKTLLDCIVYIREIIGFLFYVDEYGSVVWKHRNIYSVGNDVASLSQDPRRTDEIITIDEEQNLLSLTATLDSHNVRERIFIASTDGTSAALAQGYNPNPIGLRRVGGWTDQNFASQAECARMADFIALRQLFTYRADTVTIPGYPRIQVNDQVRIFERVTSETNLHYVSGVSSKNDMESGEWTYDLTTQWLGENPFETWIFHPKDFSKETRDFLEALGLLPADSAKQFDRVVIPTTRSTLPIGDDDVAVLVKTASAPATYITNGVTKRLVVDRDELNALVAAGLTTSRVKVLTTAQLNRIPTVT